MRLSTQLPNRTDVALCSPRGILVQQRCSKSSQLPPSLLIEHLHMSEPAAQQACEALQQQTAQQLDAADVHMIRTNSQVLASIFPRSAARALEKLVLQNPSCLLCPLDSWQDFLATYGISKQALCSLILWHSAQILTAGTPYQAGTVILTLQRWGLSSSDINRSVLLKVPQVLLLQEQQLQALQTFLVAGCGMQRQRIKDLIVAAPGVLLQDVEEQLQPRVAFLQTALGASSAQMAALLHSTPGLLLMSDSKACMQPRMELLQQLGYAGSLRLQLLLADPGLLALSLSALQRKHTYLTQRLGLGCADVLSQFPAYYSKSLMTDVGPRHAFVMVHALLHKVAMQSAAARAASMQDRCQRQEQGQQEQCIQSISAPIMAAQQCNAPWQMQEAASGQRQPMFAEYQQTRQQGKQLDAIIHLGMLLEPSLPEFLALLGMPDAHEEYAEFAQHWRETDGLQWTAVRAL